MKIKNEIVMKLLVIFTALVLLPVVLADASDLQITDLKVNDATLNNGDTTAAVQPFQQLKISFTLKNNLTDAITGVDTTVSSEPEGVEYLSPVKVNIAGGQTSPVSFTITLPLTITENIYLTTVKVAGQALDKTTKSDSFVFKLNVTQKDADVAISNVTADFSTITCQENVPLEVSYVNKGKNAEDDIIITVLKGTTELVKSTELSISQNTQESFKFDDEIFSKNLTSGSNKLDIVLSYRNGAFTSSSSITVTKNTCVSAATPAEGSVGPLSLGKSQEFKITLADQNATANVQWTVNDTIVASAQSAFTFSQNKAGEYTVKATVAGETKNWKVTVLDKPLVPKNFNTNLKSDVTQQELTAFPDFTVDTKTGVIKVVYSVPVDLHDVLDLDKVIVLSDDGVVAVDSTALPSLNKPATITLKKGFTNPVIQRSTGFNSGSFEKCPSDICTIKSNTSSQLVFTVTGFSTYKVSEQQVPSLSVSDILFDSVDLNKNATTTFKIKNSGTLDSVTSISIDLSTIPSKYKVQASNVPSSVGPGEEKTVTLQLFVPDNEEGGKHSVGTLKVNGKEANVTASVFVNPKSFLLFESIKVNGKSGGDFSIKEKNKIEVEVKNSYTEDMEDVTVTITILDVDGSDLDEESKSSDIDDGKTDDFSVEFDLTKENLNEDSYEVEITVEGEAKDNTDHKTKVIKTVNVDRDNHMIIVRKAHLGTSILDCLRETNLVVEIENVGKNNEDDVKIRVSNSALKLDTVKQDIELDKFSSSDNDFTATFHLDLANVEPGTYPILVEALRENTVEDSETLNITVNECAFAANSKTATQAQLTQAGSSLVTQLQQDLQTKQQQDNTLQQKVTAKGSFRDTSNYLVLLGLLTLLLFVALLLGVMVLVLKRK